MNDIVTKSAFASLCGVSCARVSQWLSDGKLTSEAVVGHGHRARIRVDVARAQLKQRLNITQRLATGRAKLDGSTRATGAGDSPATPGGVVEAQPVEEDIKAERLTQLRHFNKRAPEEAALRAGTYVKAADVQQQFGAVASRLMSAFEASFMPIANAIVASKAATTQDVLRTMRSTWREVRAQAAKAQGEEAITLPALVDDEVSQ
jgi:DNA-binding transcriptional regulator YdaS (Cro superfamily)